MRVSKRHSAIFHCVLHFWYQHWATNNNHKHNDKCFSKNWSCGSCMICDNILNDAFCNIVIYEICKCKTYFIHWLFLSVNVVAQFTLIPHISYSVQFWYLFLTFTMYHINCPIPIGEDMIFTGLKKTSPPHNCPRFARDRHDATRSSHQLYISGCFRLPSDNIYMYEHCIPQYSATFRSILGQTYIKWQVGVETWICWLIAVGKCIF